MFTQKDIAQIETRGSQLAIIESQIENFKQGFPFMNITKPAVVGEGIIRLEEAELSEYIAAFEAAAAEKRVIKFVPASGAASRMFKKLFAFKDEYQGTEEELAKMAEDQGRNSMHTFFARIKDFAFFADLQEAMGGAEAMEAALEAKDYTKILTFLLTAEGLNYGALPKGLLKFHKYEEAARTPLEEHLVEGAEYAKNGEGKVMLHFTVSPEHQSKFEETLAATQDAYKAALGVSEFEVGFSEQKASTDTIAVNMDDTPFRLGDDSILFRPGGHGALIENLNDIEGDIIFIKNIDNVVPDSLKEETFRYKKALAGVLLATQNRVFDYLTKMDAAEGIDEALLAEILAFLQNELCVAPAAGEADLAAQWAYARQKLNRPVRVCGMVKNEGEPGGGPFWTENSDGTTSLQIVESAQIDSSDDSKKAIVAQATHFNPVDLICSPTDYQGNKFDLLNFRDPKTGFIAYKSKNGKDLKAQELPGLWNGAMADWNTLFVEVPIITFNPVKMVSDLLRPEHQA